MDRFEIQVNRNIKGIDLEKSGQLDKAITLYEENVREGFEGSHPYNRLAIIYKKQGRLNEEIRILDIAVTVFTEIAIKGRSDGELKLKKFKERLEKARNKTK